MDLSPASPPRLRDHLPTLGFCLYALLLAPPLARLLRAGLDRPDPLWLPGALLALLLLVEPFGLVWKIRFLRRRNRETGWTPAGGMLPVFATAGIAHIIVSSFLALMLLDCWALLDNPQVPQFWPASLFILIVFRDFVTLFVCGGNAVAPEPPGHWKESTANFILWLFAAVVYTAWWSALLNLGDLGDGPAAEKFVALPFIAALFAFLYLPMRLDWLLEEYHLHPAAGRKARLLTELAIATLLGLLPALWP